MSESQQLLRKFVRLQGDGPQRLQLDAPTPCKCVSEDPILICCKSACNNL